MIFSPARVFSSVLLALLWTGIIAAISAAPSAPVVRFTSPAASAVLKSASAELTLELTSAEPLPDTFAVALFVDDAPPRWLDAQQFRATPAGDGTWRYVATHSLQSLSQGGHAARAVFTANQARPQPLSGAWGQAHFYVGREDFKNHIGDGKPHLMLLTPPAGRVDLAAGEPLAICFLVGQPGATRVRYQLDNQTPVLVSGQGPVFLSKIAPGRHELTVDLVDEAERPVQGNFTFAKRIFEVRIAQVAQAVGPQDRWWDDQISPDLQQEPLRAAPAQEASEDDEAMD
jgi:hypothetical protein